MLLVKLSKGLGLIFLDIVVGDPQARDTAPEVAGELGKRVQEAVVNYLGHHLVGDVGKEGENEFRDDGHGVDQSETLEAAQHESWALEHIKRGAELEQGSSHGRIEARELHTGP